jgi:hypothetical protein
VIACHVLIIQRSQTRLPAPNLLLPCATISYLQTLAEARKPILAHHNSIIATPQSALSDCL